MGDKDARARRRLTRRDVVAASAAALAIPAILRHTRAYAQEPVIRIGYVSALTGVHARTAVADPHVLAGIRAILANGLENNGRRVRVEILHKDSQSTHAGDAAAELVFGEKVDLIAATSTPDATNPVADLAEVNGVPCITTDSPWQPFFFGRGGNPEIGFDWTYHFYWGVEDVIAAFIALWSEADTGTVVGGVFSNGPDTKDWTSPKSGFPAALEKIGFGWVQSPTYASPFASRSPYAGQQPPDDFFQPQIDAVREAGCQILTANMSSNDLALFWDQATARGYKPPVATIARALLYPSDIALLGSRARNLTTEVWWAPSFPYHSSLTGQSAQEFADEYKTVTGSPWEMSMGFKHALFEVIIDVVKRADDLDDPAAIADAIASTRHDTIVGPVEWTGEPVKNVAKTPVVTGQWQEGASELELVIVDNSTAPDIPVGGFLRLLQ